MLETDDGRILVESNAILHWLAQGGTYWPCDPWQQAQALSWMFFEQDSHEPYIAVARFISISGWVALDSPRRKDLPALRERGHTALSVMEKHLIEHPWFGEPVYGIADIALYAYTHVAPDGGIALNAYPAIRRWLADVEATSGFVAMPLPDATARELIAQS